jgi:mannose-1-phosphate guanylyltransferase
MSGHTWTIVLAAGDGSRLRSLTTTRSGLAIPKQFCSLRGGASLLEEALARAEAVSAREHICIVVAEQHRRFWEYLLESRDAANIIVQPENKGTANGILLPLLHILQRDPEASILLLPSDHHVQDEGVLAQYLRKAVHATDQVPDELVLLGMEPDELDPDLGYIVPSHVTSTSLGRVAQFIEKPTEATARDLMRRGALWNIFIVAVRGNTLLRLFERAIPAEVGALRRAVARDAASPHQPVETRAAYRELKSLDFSRDIAQRYESALRVLPVASCGWSDLGTPGRVGQALQRERSRWCDARTGDLKASLSLAAQHALHQHSGFIASFP